MYHYFYKITNTINGHFYYGIHMVYTQPIIWMTDIWALADIYEGLTKNLV